tara:strand:+ start:656 stop:1630 length:975 start_codon:yes stop_codon:yes gene_type:complete
MSLIGQARSYGNNLSKLASIDFKTDATQWYKGNITFNVANSDGTDPSKTPLEAARIDSSGNLLVGTTSTTVGGATSGKGFRVDGASGIIQAAASGNTSAIFNRTSSDGAIVSLRKNGTAVGSIGVANSNNLTIGGSVAAHAGFEFGTNIIMPLSGGSQQDAAVDIGYTNVRFKDLRLSGGVYLGGTGAANKLDDYEEGTFTLTISVEGQGNATQSNSIANYTKIGNIVHVTFSTGTLSNIPNPSTGRAWQYGGLPFTSKNNTGHTPLTLRVQSLAADANFGMCGFLYSNSNAGRIEARTATSTANFSPAMNGANLQVSVTYRTA